MQSSRHVCLPHSPPPCCGGRRAPPGQGMNASEQRAMYTLWASLPGAWQRGRGMAMLPCPAPR